MLGLEQKLRDAGAPEAYIQNMLNEQKEASTKKSASRMRIATAITKWWNGTKCVSARARARAVGPASFFRIRSARATSLSSPSLPPLPPSVRPTTGAGGFARPRLASPAGSTSRW